MRLPPTIGDAPLPPPDEPPPEDSEPYEPSEPLEAGDMPEELDLHFEELNREDPEPPEEIDSIVPEISKMNMEPAEVSAWGGPVTFSKEVKKSRFQRFLHKMVQTRGRNTWKEVQLRGSSPSETLA